MISERERFLMRQAMAASEYYHSLESWMGEVIDDSGHTAEQFINHEADVWVLKQMEQTNNG